MRTKFIARFSDGTEITRTSDKRVYTHAYLARGTYVNEGQARTWTRTGFSTSADQARKNMHSETGFIRSATRIQYKQTFEEVVAVVIDDSKLRRAALEQGAAP